VAEIYRKRWSIEGLFQRLEASLHSEVRSLGIPAAALLAFCTAVVWSESPAQTQREGCPAQSQPPYHVERVATKSPNKKFLVRRIEEALAARATESEPASAPQPPAKRTARPSESVVATTEPTDIDPPKTRGRFASMTVEELQAKYLEVVQRPTSSVARTYLLWKIREAEKGRIPVGPRKTRERNGEPVDVKILPLRLEAEVVERMDEAWRTRGIKNRMEFFRGAIGAYLT
jgi:hypothetical protein